MPHITKGGKYIFGWSAIRSNGEILIPAEAVQEYRLEAGEKVILITGSKASGGFVVAKKAYLEQSALSGILTTNPELAQFQIADGHAILYKGRRYGWTTLLAGGVLKLSERTLATFEIKPADRLLSIRGSNLAFVLAAKGPIVEKARLHPEIRLFE